MKLINADELLKLIPKEEINAVMAVVNIPEAVVRCRDCVYCLFGYQCLPHDEPTKPDNYCWKGRREDATD